MQKQNNKNPITCPIQVQLCQPHHNLQKRNMVCPTPREIKPTENNDNEPCGVCSDDMLAQNAKAVTTASGGSTKLAGKSQMLFITKLTMHLKTTHPVSYWRRKNCKTEDKKDTSRLYTKSDKLNLDNVDPLDHTLPETSHMSASKKDDSCSQIYDIAHIQDLMSRLKRRMQEMLIFKIWSACSQRTGK